MRIGKNLAEQAVVMSARSV